MAEGKGGSQKVGGDQTDFRLALQSAFKKNNDDGTFGSHNQHEDLERGGVTFGGVRAF